MSTTPHSPGLRPMTFKQALVRLGIEDYGERIFNSNSHGELFHLLDYIRFADKLADAEVVFFRPLFLACVDFADKNWQRPESCFQHMPRLISEALSALDAARTPAHGDERKE